MVFLLKNRRIMKYFLALFLAFSTFFGFNQLAASEADKHVRYEWSGTEEELYLHIDLSQDFAFEYDFITMTTKNGKGRV